MMQTSFFHHSAEERFERFHAKNPKVYQLLCQRARELKSKGFKEYSLRTLWEVMRWHSHLHVDSSDGFKLCNDHAPFYARKIMRDEPDLRGFFTTREHRRKDGRNETSSRKREQRPEASTAQEEIGNYPD